MCIYTKSHTVLFVHMLFLNTNWIRKTLPNKLTFKQKTIRSSRSILFLTFTSLFSFLTHLLCLPQLSVKGYSDKQHILLKKIIEKMATFEIDEKRFNIIKEAVSFQCNYFELILPCFPFSLFPLYYSDSLSSAPNFCPTGCLALISPSTWGLWITSELSSRTSTPCTTSAC